MIRAWNSSFFHFFHPGMVSGVNDQGLPEMVPDLLQEFDQMAEYHHLIRSIRGREFFYLEIGPLPVQREIFVPILCNRVGSIGFLRFHGIFRCRDRDALDCPISIVQVHVSGDPVDPSGRAVLPEHHAGPARLRIVSRKPQRVLLQKLFVKHPVQVVQFA